MKIGTKEHYDMIEDFEKKIDGRKDKETKELWKQGNVYQNGEMNNLFKAYCLGYSSARCEYIN